MKRVKKKSCAQIYIVFISSLTHSLSCSLTYSLTHLLTGRMGGSPHAITFPLFTSERSLPLPIVLYGLFCSFTSEFTAYNLLSPYFVHYSPSPHIGAIRDLHTQLNSTRFFALPFPFPSSNDSLHCTEI